MPPLAHYKLNDDAANTDVADASGNALHGTASTNTENLSVAAKLNDGFNLAATHYVALPDGTSSGLGGAEGATIVAWVKRSGIGTRQTLFRVAFTAASKATLEFQTNNTIRAGGRAVAGDPYLTVDTTGTYTDTASWHMIAAVFDLPNDTIKIYYDGELVKSGSASFLQNTFSAEVGDVNSLGCYTDGNYIVNGIQDDTRFYAAALTAGQIERLYNAGHGTEKSLVELYAENDGPLRPVLRS